MEFRFLEVHESDMLDKIFAFRYKVMKDTEMFQGYFRETAFQDDKESDIYDPFSIHFTALDEDGEVCATVRLIYNSPHGYPTENGMTFDHSMFESNKLGELSRIFIASKYRNLQSTKFIVKSFNKLIYNKMVDLGIEYTYGAIEPSFKRLLQMYKMHYEVIGKKQLLGSMGLRFPCILYTKRLGDDNPEFMNTSREQYA